jgi:hypothetical protein
MVLMAYCVLPLQNNLHGTIPYVTSGPFTMPMAPNITTLGSDNFGVIVLSPQSPGYGLCGTIPPNFTAFDLRDFALAGDDLQLVNPSCGPIPASSTGAPRA